MLPSKSSPAAGSAERYLLVETIPFVLAHLACFAAIWTGVHAADLIIAAGLYALRMFAVTAGYHRYFAHRSFKTSRAFAFVLAFLAQSSAQRGILWWAGNHRQHHRFSDTDGDVHSPILRGFWHAHLGWFFTDKHRDTDLDAVPDLAKYPELVWLDRHPYLPAIVLGLVSFGPPSFCGTRPSRSTHWPT
jgi:stearoyl-CoA desaturase (delta-9 desaturase)